MKLNELLDKLKGNTVMYRGRYVKVVGYRIADGQVTVVTEDGEWLEWSLQEAQKQVRELRPVAHNNNEVSLQILPKGTMNTLTDTLIQNIKRVQEDPKYVKQAAAINQGVATLINMAKLQLQLARAQRKES